MTEKRRFGWLVVALSLALASGCGDDDGGAPADGDGGMAGRGGDPDGGGSSGRGGSGGRSGSGGSGGSGGGGSDDCLKRGPVTEDTTWEPIEECPDGFEVRFTVEVRNTGTTLTIAPGTKLKFAMRASLDVRAGATLVAAGTEDDPIVFTGWQELPGSWGGVIIRSSSVDNEISHAVVEYAGASDGPSGAIALSREDDPGRLALRSTTIRDNAKFGLTVLRTAVLSAFEDNTITGNEEGAIRVEAPAVHQLAGTGNTIEDNGDDNIVRIETNILMPITDDVTWPNLAPAVYRVTGPNGTGGEPVFVDAYLTIEAGTVLEMASGSGFEVRQAAGGLAAVGTEDAKIVFRGVDGSGWSGIGYCESPWEGNALEHVEVHNAMGPAPAWGLCGTGATNVRRAGILVGHNFNDEPSYLRIRDLTVSGPNNAAADIAVNTPESELVQEGTNTGTGDGGALEVEEF